MMPLAIIGALIISGLVGLGVWWVIHTTKITDKNVKKKGTK